MPVRLVLRLNAIFSGAGGLGLLLLSEPLADAFGISRMILLAVGLGLVVYAADLSVVAVRNGLRRAVVLQFAGADAAWVLASIGVLVVWPEALSLAGRLALAAAAIPVTAFAALQYRGARTLR